MAEINIAPFVVSGSGGGSGTSAENIATILDSEGWQFDGESYTYGKFYKNVAPYIKIYGVINVDDIEINDHTMVIPADTIEEKITMYGAGYNASIGTKVDAVIKMHDAQISLSNNSVSIANFNNNVTINAGYSNDTISNYGANVSINAGGGNDTIHNYGDGVTIYAGYGSDKIYNYNGGTNGVAYQFGANEQNTTIVGFDATKDILQFLAVSTSLDNSAVSLSPDKKKITLNQGNTTVILYAGDNNTYSMSDQVQVSIGAASAANVAAAEENGENYAKKTLSIKQIVGTNASEDFGVNTTDEVNIMTGYGNDTVTNYGASVTINASGSGNDSLVNYGTGAIIDGGFGNDFIYNGNDETNQKVGNNASINAGGGNDTIHNYGDGVTINAGVGYDTIYNYNTGTNGVVYQFGANEQNTTIVGFDFAHDTLQFRNGTTPIEGTSVSLSPDKKKITFNQNNANVILYAGENNTYSMDTTIQVSIGAASAQNSANAARTVTPKILAGTSGSDNITNTSANITINSNNGNDVINNSATKVFIDAGSSGNDEITNSGTEVTSSTGTKTSINAGYGNDTIVNSAAEVTIYGGGGNDSIRNHSDGGVTYRFGANEGNNTIVGFNFEKDIIQFKDSTTLPDSSKVSLTSGYRKIELLEKNSRVILYANEGDRDYTFDDGIDISIGGTNAGRSKVKPGVLVGTTLADEFGTVTADNVRIVTFGGDDTLVTKAKSVLINAQGGGNKKITVDNKENDTANSDTGVSLMSGSGADTLTIKRNYTYVTDQGGLNKYNITSGKNTIIGATGAETFTVAGANNTINSGLGNDSGNNNSFYDGNGNDVFILQDNATGNTINSGIGNDSITSNGKGNYFVGNFSTTGYIDTISGWADNLDCFVFNTLENLTITQTISGSNVRLTFTQDDATYNVLLIDKGTGNTVRYTATPGNASSIQIYTIT